MNFKSKMRPEWVTMRPYEAKLCRKCQRFYRSARNGNTCFTCLRKGEFKREISDCKKEWYTPKIRLETIPE